MKKLFTILTATFIALTFAANASTEEFKIQIQDHKFNPETLEVPAGKKIKLIVENKDKTIEEFESHDLNREKLISGGKSVTIFVGPLEAGEYKFFGEFHPKTAQGILVVK